MNERSFKLLSGKVKSREGATVYGLPGASKALLLKRVAPLIGTFFLVVPVENLAEALAEDLSRFGLKALHVPAWDVPPLDVSSPLSLASIGV